MNENQTNLPMDKGIEASPNTTNSVTSRCKNCNTPLTGPFCHQCGQPNKSVIRFCGELIKELLEDVIRLDSRAARTLFALLFKPGFLTLEYLKGKRFSYIPPLRLFIITSVLSVFVLWVQNKVSPPDFNIEDSDKQEQVETKETPETPEPPDDPLKTETQEAASVAEDSSSKNDKEASTPKNQFIGLHIDEDGKVTTGLSGTSANSDGKAEDSKKEAYEEKQPKKKDEPEASDDEFIGVHVDKEGEVRSNIPLPFVDDEDAKEINDKLRDKIKEKIEKAKQYPDDFVEEMLAMIPRTTLLMIPFFALLMKLSYPFSRRYYMEHIINALHGHSFLFLVILISATVGELGESLIDSESTALSWFGSLLSFADSLLRIWVPIYFLIAIKRIYQQGWWLTTFKWLWLGILYILMFSMFALLMFIVSVLLD
ncbi:DUF3667 domain-containing protein [Pleionea sp. CnH1-48]|uniref:DUF3667 domain-containing protein n=1 Tax=Pleionea sp. CnH1-48 TaxID=2954494 RepID=UPI0020977C5C|nr:DUF3667 domain-containing protein [Pleionea sp. CnH1-48]MCO7227366.1 DUF3667 domain-containing protein [Pleionea sp. CnH1-48]